MVALLVNWLFVSLCGLSKDYSLTHSHKEYLQIVLQRESNSTSVEGELLDNTKMISEYVLGHFVHEQTEPTHLPCD